MTYAEFKRLRAENKLIFGIGDYFAIRVVDYLPVHRRRAYVLWTVAWVLSIPVFIAVSILFRWWAGLFLLLVVTPMMIRATRKSASRCVLDQAEDDEQFFGLLVERDFLTFKAVPGKES